MEYITTFQRHLLHCNDVPEIDKILWFQRGLNPDLHQMSVVDHTGNTWSELHQLIQYVRGCDRILHAQNNAARTNNHRPAYKQQDTRKTPYQPSAHKTPHAAHAQITPSKKRPGTPSAAPAKRQAAANKNDGLSWADRPLNYFGNKEDINRMNPKINNHQAVSCFKQGKCVTCFSKLDVCRKNKGDKCQIKHNPKPWPADMQLSSEPK